MKKTTTIFLHLFLIILVIASLAISVSAFLVYVAASICGGSECQAFQQSWYMVFYVFYSFGYLLIVLITLTCYGIYMYAKKNPRGYYILLFPLLLAIPFIIIDQQQRRAEAQHQSEAEIAFFTPAPSNYVCNSKRFLIYEYTLANRLAFRYERIYEDRIHKKVGEGVNSGMTYPYNELVGVLKKDGIDINQCKNKAGQGVPPSNQPFTEDYICSPSKFVIFQIDNTNRPPLNFYELRIHNLTQNKTDSRSYKSYDGLKKALQNLSIDINQCKNKYSQVVPKI